jgi:hypothetical protein
MFVLACLRLVGSLVVRSSGLVLEVGGSFAWFAWFCFSLISGETRWYIRTHAVDTFSRHAAIHLFAAPLLDPGLSTGLRWFSTHKLDVSTVEPACYLDPSWCIPTQYLVSIATTPSLVSSSFSLSLLSIPDYPRPLHLRSLHTDDRMEDGGLPYKSKMMSRTSSNLSSFLPKASPAKTFPFLLPPVVFATQYLCYTTSLDFATPTRTQPLQQV